MLIYGDLIAAGLEELESDPTTSLFSGRIYRNTTTGEIKMYTGTSWKTVLDKDTEQTLSGKTIDSSCTVSSSASLPVVPASKGGTGVANNDAATLTRAGSHALTVTTTDTTSVTLPTTGTLATLSGSEFLVNKVVASTSLTTGGLKLPTGNSTTERPSGTVTDLKGMIRYNDTDDVFEGYNELGGWSSIGGGGTTDRITQASHGFVVGDVLYLNGALYTKAIASAANTAEVVGVVSKIIDTSQFELTLSGEVSGLLAASFTEGSLPDVGEAVFLSGSVAGKLTITEPTVVGHVSLPVGVVSESIASPAGRKLYVAIKRGAVVGGANARTQIPLANAATSTVQNVSAYEAGELTGWVSISATTPLKFYVTAQFSKNGAGNNYNISYQTSGDTPPVGFLLQVTSAGLVQAVLPSITGFGSASITYALNAPAIGTSFPLSVPSSSIVWSEPVAFRNRLINGEMKVAQYGSTSISNNQTKYGGCDRWAVGLSGFTTGSGIISRGGPTATGSYVQQVQATTTGSGAVSFQQRIEAINCADLNGQTVTVSLVMFQDTGSTISPTINFFKPTALDNWTSNTFVSGQSVSLPSGQRIRFTYTTTLGSTDASNGLSVQINIPIGAVTGAFLQIQDVQLELGSIATPFERRPIGVELALCQRYFNIIQGVTGSFPGFAKSPGTATDCYIFYPEMRISPTISSSATLTFTPYSFSAGATVSTTTTWAYNPGLTTSKKSIISLTSHGSISAGSGVSIDISGGSFLISAEL